MPDDTGLTLEALPCGRNGTATVFVKLAGDIIEQDKLDLSKSKARAAFAAALCAKRSGIDKAMVENELLKLAASMVTKPEAEPTAESKPDSAALLASMPESAKTEARMMLEAPNLVARILDDIGALGVAGEKELALTVYLIGVSRLLTRPLAGIVQGPSSSGKSYLNEKVASLFPPETVVHATQMTPQALFHMPPGSLENRFIVAGERSRLENDETAEATRALREMISAGKLVKLMPVKVNGEIITQTIEQNGPVAYVESTTLSRIFDEDRNRCILLTTDERKDQTRLIVNRLAITYGGGQPEGDVERIVQRHHAVQRMLEPHFVVVPFAARLGELFPVDRVEARRAYPQLIGAIQASALLHQRQRKLDEGGRIVAEPDDYELAQRLLEKPTAQMLGGRLSDPAQRFYERLLQRRPNRAEHFSSSDARKGETASKRSVLNWLGELHDAGLLETVAASRGRTATTWKFPDELPQDDLTANLPTLEGLFPGIACTHAHNS
ncbi:MAG: hypothetical protein ACYC35_19720 [Pirellulales bacterium]